MGDINLRNLTSITLGDVHRADTPDFSDAYLEQAFDNSRQSWLSEAECQWVSENEQGFINRLAYEQAWSE